MKRKLTSHEKKAIIWFAERLPENERLQIIKDMNDSLAESVTDDGSRVLFEISGYQRPPYKGQHPFSIEGKTKDSDGADLDVLLHADENNRLLELEIIRWDSGGVISPNWDKLVEK